MKIKGIVDENFQDYKKPAMLIAMNRCDWKCLKEQGLDCSICQNSSIAQQKDYEVSIDYICDRYLANPLTQAIVFGGLEPILQFNEILEFIERFRLKSCDDIVIYTGYYPNEIQSCISELKKFNNIVMKFGRLILNSKQKYDEVLGITLNSENQFAERIDNK